MSNVALAVKPLPYEVQTMEKMHYAQSGYIAIFILLLIYTVVRTPSSAGFVLGYKKISLWKYVSYCLRHAEGILSTYLL